MRPISLDWLAQQAKLAPREKEACTLLLVDGYTLVGTAHAMRITIQATCSHWNRSVAKMQAAFDKADQWDQILWEAVLDEPSPSQPGTARTYMKELLKAMRAHRKSAPRTATYDSNGRVVGGRDPLVSVEDALTASAQAQAQREREAAAARQRWEERFQAIQQAVEIARAEAALIG